MPIVDVHWVLSPKTSLPEGTTTRLADAIGEALGTEAGHLWLRLHPVPATQYAENGVPGASTPLPVFVTVLHGWLGSQTELEAEAQALAKAVAATLVLDKSRVHIEYAPAGAGRMAFGGRLIH